MSERKRPVLKFDPVTGSVARVRPVLRFGSGEESARPGGRPVLDLDTAPDVSDEARFARSAEGRARWARIVNGRKGVEDDSESC